MGIKADPIPDAPANPGRTMTLQGALQRLKEFGPKVAKKIYKTMQNEVPIGPTGNLKKSLYWEQTGSEEWFIGTKQYYAKWVEEGRGPVTAKNAPFLQYQDYFGGHKSIHNKNLGKAGYNGVWIRKKSVAKAEPNPFVERTKKDVEKMTFTL